MKAGLKPGDEGFGVESDDRAGELVVLGDGDQPRKEVHKNVKPETYARLYKEFAEAVEGAGEAAVPVKAAEARDVLRIIEAARKSAKTGNKVDL